MVSTNLSFDGVMPIYCKEEEFVGRKKYVHFGPKGGKRQWCATCAKRYGGVQLTKQKMCP